MTLIHGWGQHGGVWDALLARLPALRGTVVGWSMGGQAALRWAQRNPSRVRRVVLFATTPFFGAVPRAFVDLVRADPGRALQRFADLMADGEADERGVREALRAQLASRPAPARDQLLEGLRLLEETDLRESLRTSPPRQPVLLIHGERDAVTPVAAGRWLVDALPRARLLALPSCGHAPMVSHAAEAAAAIRDFIDAT